MAKVSSEYVRGLEAGAGLAFAAAAGLADNAGLDAARLAALFDGLAHDQLACEALIRVFLRHVMMDRDVTPSDFMEAIYDLLLAHAGKGAPV